MKKLKYEILFIILFMTVGIAAVSSNLLINGSTPIASNPDDFNVYFADVSGDAVVKSSTQLHIMAELQNLNDEGSVTFLVVNGSKNYDASIKLSCVGFDEYITGGSGLERSFLEAGGASYGVVVIRLEKTYTGDDVLTSEITCDLVATPIERDSLGDDAGYEPAVSNIEIISFTIEGSLYYAEEGMYWSDWVNSPYNTDGFTIYEDELNFRVLPPGNACFVNPDATSDSLLEYDGVYTMSCDG